jgi:hypothetical protein
MLETPAAHTTCNMVTIFENRHPGDFGGAAHIFM